MASILGDYLGIKQGIKSGANSGCKQRHYGSNLIAKGINAYTCLWNVVLQNRPIR